MSITCNQVGTKQRAYRVKLLSQRGNMSRALRPHYIDGLMRLRAHLGFRVVGFSLRHAF